MYAWLLVGADGWVLMWYQEGRTLLWWAASKGRTEVMAVLLAHDADVEAPDKVRVALPAEPVPVTAGSNQPCQKSELTLCGVKMVRCY